MNCCNLFKAYTVYVWYQTLNKPGYKQLSLVHQCCEKKIKNNMWYIIDLGT